MEDLDKYNIPWDLISGSISGSLTAEEQHQLKHWLDNDPENKKRYADIQTMWKNGLEDYKYYRQANENEAWEALSSKLQQPDPEKRIINVKFAQRQFNIIKFTAVAAVFLGLVGLALWLLLLRNNSAIYETSENEQKVFLLTDGTSMTLKSNTRVELSPDYNKKNRVILMTSGEVYFEVKHLPEKPFIIELGSTQVKDIGTSFTVKKDETEIKVDVTAGKVAFEKHKTGEVRELTAGNKLVYNLQNESFGETKSNNSSSEDQLQLLNFNNTPLSQVLISIEKAFGKKVIADDSITANKKLTAHLGGMSYNKAMEVICKSMSLIYTEDDSIGILKKDKH
jgi:Fe2+-dicitrate sensor, membrane component